MARERVPFRTRALFESKEEWAQLKQDYLAANDPLEYNFVRQSKILESWEHWQFVLKSPYCRPDVEKWRELLEIQIRAEAFANILKTSRADKGFQAQKFLLEGGWIKKRGRPSKAEVEGEKKKHAAILDEVDELFQTASGAKLN